MTPEEKTLYNVAYAEAKTKALKKLAISRAAELVKQAQARAESDTQPRGHRFKQIVSRAGSFVKKYSSNSGQGGTGGFSMTNYGLSFGLAGPTRRKKTRRRPDSSGIGLKPMRFF